jgi:polysaccharide export outer membrane protein
MRMYKLALTVTSSLVLLTPLSLIPLEVQAQVSREVSPSSSDVPLLLSQRIETPYTLGAGDRLQVSVFNVPEYSGEYQVLVDGTLNLPIVGSLNVADLTITQTTELISRQYAPFLRRPIVTVSLIAPRPLEIAIAGEVRSPGSYLVEVAGGQQFPTVTQAVQLAGGITRAAQVRQVQLRRFYQGQEQRYNIDLWRLLQNADLAQDLTLRDGDTLYIPRTNEINPLETRVLADSSFAGEEQSIEVAVVGGGNSPGGHSLQEGAVERAAGEGLTGQGGQRVTGAIASAGGITPLANIRNVELRRTTRDGTTQTLEVNLWDLLQSGNVRQDVLLQEGDTIFVPTASDINPSEINDIASATFSPETIQVNVVGEVNNPGAVAVPPNTPLNQAILNAGGFNNRRANQNEVTLVRLNPNGTATKRRIDIDFERGINEAGNPPLRNNDVVVVGRSGLTQVSDGLGTLLAPVTGAFSIFRIFGAF